MVALKKVLWPVKEERSKVKLFIAPCNEAPSIHIAHVCEFSVLRNVGFLTLLSLTVDNMYNCIGSK